MKTRLIFTTLMLSMICFSVFAQKSKYKTNNRSSKTKYVQVKAFKLDDKNTLQKLEKYDHSKYFSIKGDMIIPAKGMGSYYDYSQKLFVITELKDWDTNTPDFSKRDGDMPVGDITIHCSGCLGLMECLPAIGGGGGGPVTVVCNNGCQYCGMSWSSNPKSVSEFQTMNGDWNDTNDNW